MFFIYSVKINYFIYFKQELDVEEDHVFWQHLERIFPAERRVRHGKVFEGRGQYGRNGDGAVQADGRAGGQRSRTGHSRATSFSCHDSRYAIGRFAQSLHDAQFIEKRIDLGQSHLHRQQQQQRQQPK